MRIISGLYRGRTITAPKGDATRPTADRTREALFSMLTSRLGSFEGLRVADFFAGSGPTRDQVVYLGRLLREMWTAKIHRDFPGKKIVVSFSEAHYERLLDYEITVYQEQDAG